MKGPGQEHGAIMLKDQNAAVVNQTKERLEALAEFITTTTLKLPRVSIYLRYEDYRDGGYSMLGLVCEAYAWFTGNGRWRRSAAPKVPDFVSDGEVTDRFLPLSVVAYFGLRDNLGSFFVGQLPQGVKELMYKTRKTASSSLYDIGLTYPHKGKEIAVEVLRAMPSSLLKRDDAEVRERLRRILLENPQRAT